MNRHMHAFAGSLVATLAITASAWSQGFTDPRIRATDPGCTDMRLVAAGAPFPQDPNTLAVRWTGYSNWELAYKNQVLLLDVYFDRGATFMPLGFKAAEVQRANAILIGHGHSDHMSDAASIATRLSIPVVGAPVTAEKLAQMSVPAGQIKSVTGKDPKSETMQVGVFKIEPTLGRHGEPPPNITAAFNAALTTTTAAYTAEEQAEMTMINQRGTSDPKVTGEGTIAYVITLDNGFTIMYRDSGGVVTEQEKATMERQKNVDLGLIAVSAAILNNETVTRAIEHLDVYKPAIYWPGHNDANRRGLWRATEPLFQAAKDKYPTMTMISRTYREPVCFDTRIQKSR